MGGDLSVKTGPEVGGWKESWLLWIVALCAVNPLPSQTLQWLFPKPWKMIYSSVKGMNAPG